MFWFALAVLLAAHSLAFAPVLPHLPGMRAYFWGAVIFPVDHLAVEVLMAGTLRLLQPVKLKARGIS